MVCSPDRHRRRGGKLHCCKENEVRLKSNRSAVSVSHNGKETRQGNVTQGAAEHAPEQLLIPRDEVVLAVIKPDGLRFEKEILRAIASEGFEVLESFRERPSLSRACGFIQSSWGLSAEERRGMHQLLVENEEEEGGELGEIRRFLETPASGEIIEDKLERAKVASVYLSSGESRIILLRKRAAAHSWLKLKFSLRDQFSTDLLRNAVHGADSVNVAVREAVFWFGTSGEGKGGAGRGWRLVGTHILRPAACEPQPGSGRTNLTIDVTPAVWVSASEGKATLGDAAKSVGRVVEEEREKEMKAAKGLDSGLLCQQLLYPPVGVKTFRGPSPRILSGALRETVGVLEGEREEGDSGSCERRRTKEVVLWDLLGSEAGRLACLAAWYFPEHFAAILCSPRKTEDVRVVKANLEVVRSPEAAAKRAAEWDRIGRGSRGKATRASQIEAAASASLLPLLRTLEASQQNDQEGRGQSARTVKETIEEACRRREDPSYRFPALSVLSVQNARRLPDAAHGCENGPGANSDHTEKDSKSTRPSAQERSTKGPPVETLQVSESPPAHTERGMPGHLTSPIEDLKTPAVPLPSEGESDRRRSGEEFVSPDFLPVFFLSFENGDEKEAEEILSFIRTVLLDPQVRFMLRGPREKKKALLEGIPEAEAGVGCQRGSRHKRTWEGEEERAEFACREGEVSELGTKRDSASLLSTLLSCFRLIRSVVPDAFMCGILPTTSALLRSPPSSMESVVRQHGQPSTAFSSTASESKNSNGFKNPQKRKTSLEERNSALPDPGGSTGIDSLPPFVLQQIEQERKAMVGQRSLQTFVTKKRTIFWSFTKT
uniref:Nucleoside diphosphate kinase-like domain-containing protein n=1 Tax=Chromera velia CCMP2878 TaxID=1169474 RepID=A0A0G4I590_9ALVE|eukprot:Cvel_11123.t1-p1 / transcript=Cvel_11123.t1 / gene=Cvel_11123 / organism=Chromera_velia_CCMP2878 / gene_product=hypothetical protein / transcript_product=hypothetical protein / location=Cvel_scaffold689:11869-17173(+) / protein_length=830 / sequence_SO=supercontig / SO=protein_coding / is_pseudo=false